MMENNGSPAPIFETEDSYFMTTLKIHPDAKSHAKVQPKSNELELPDITSLESIDALLEQLLSLKEQPDFELSNYVGNQVSNQVSNQVDEKVKKALHYCKIQKSRKEILENGLEISNQTKNYKRYIEPLVELDWLERTLPDSPNAPNQKYLLSSKGKLLLEILNSKQWKQVFHFIILFTMSAL